MGFFEWIKSVIEGLKKLFSSETKPSTPATKPEAAPETKPSAPAKFPEALKGLIEGTPEWYRKAYEICAIRPGYESAVKNDALFVLSNKARYETVGLRLGVPWYVIGGYHFKEASGSFAGVLHNGEKILGTGRKTSIVPKGRGPFSTWEEAAEDALRLKNYQNITDWELGNLLYLAERYNGTGYITGAGKDETSPYLWARTNINDGAGKYVSDGKFDPGATTLKTTGYVAILKYLEDNGHIKIKRKSEPASRPTPIIPKTKTEQFLAYAATFIGVPYQWGGDFKRWKANKDFGLDCSGFEQALAEWQGIDEPGDQTADGIMRHYLAKGGSKVDFGKEEVGDRAFYGSGKKATHIVVVVGKNKIVGANGGGSKTTTEAIAKAQNAKVKYDSLDYRSDLICIIRPVEWGSL